MNLHLGSGPIILPNFINVDSAYFWNPDVCMDYLKMDQKWDENSADTIYSCHSIEHLEWPAGVQTFMAQAFRVLKPSGVMRLVVPDFRKVALKYVEGEDLKDLFGGEHFYGIDCAATRFLYFCREWQHTVIFDYPLLHLLLTEAGFTNIRQMPFSVSDTPILNGLDRYPSESISVEASKP